MQTTTNNDLKTPKSVLVLRACNPDMSSYNNFIWPTLGPVEAPDWKPTTECGNGLHGWLHGHGNGSTSPYWGNDCKWLVVEVKSKHIVDLDGKVKFKKGNVVFCGDRKGATDYILANDPIASTKPVIGAMITTGDQGTSVSGYKGTSTSGDCGTSTSGDRGISTSGDRGISTSGDYGKSTSSKYGTATSGYYGKSTSGWNGKSTSGDNGTSTSGYSGKSISGYHGTSTSGNCGTSTSGYSGKSISGYKGTSTSGNYGTSTSGRYGTSISGCYGTSTSGENGTILIKYWKNDRSYSKVGHIGEDGLEPNVAYKLDDSHNFVKV